MQAIWSVSSGANIDVASNVAVSLGLSTSRTTTYSMSTYIQADPARYSKLGFASDFFEQYYRYTKSDGNNIIESENSHITTPTINTYLLPYYLTNN